MTRKWLQSADVEIDDDGALLVKVSGADIASIKNNTAPSAANASSGPDAKATTSDSAVEAIAANANADYHHLRIVNTGGVSGFFSFDGITWHLLAAVAGGITSLTMDGILIHNHTVQIKRIAGGTNLAGVYASAW